MVNVRSYKQRAQALGYKRRRNFEDARLEAQDLEEQGRRAEDVEEERRHSEMRERYADDIDLREIAIDWGSTTGVEDEDEVRERERRERDWRQREARRRDEEVVENLRSFVPGFYTRREFRGDSRRSSRPSSGESQGSSRVRKLV